MGRAEGRKRAPKDPLGDLTPGGARAADTRKPMYAMTLPRPPLGDE
jgi:hypothetical protein